MSISPAYAATMARYNRWQNGAVFAAAGTLGDDRRRMDRGAFFGSIHSTLSHLYWGDSYWMHRFAGWDKPAGGIADSPRFVAGWDDLAARRAAFDARLVAWADGLDAAWLAGDLSWYARALDRTMTQPRWLALTHFFNHQTHHRGQVHALLTGFGARTADTDLVLMPEA